MSNDGEKYKTPAKIQPNVENNSHSMMLGYVTKPTPVILDVGCACGDLGVALKEYKNATVFGLEYSNDSIAIAKSTGAYADVRQSDLDAFTANDVQEWQGKFDYVICGDVLEHLRNPTRTVSELVNFLKPDGEFIASIPNVAHMYVVGELISNQFPYMPCGLLDETHIRFFTSESIVNMLSQVGLIVYECLFSMCGKNEHNGLNPWPLVPPSVQKVLFSKVTSYVKQYVFRAGLSEISSESLKQRNADLLTITEGNAPSYILAERQRLLAEVGLTPEEKEIESKNAQLDEVLNSRSWRITKPLRFVGKVVRFLKNPSGYQFPECYDIELRERYGMMLGRRGFLSLETVRSVYLMSGKRLIETFKYVVYAAHKALIVRRRNSLMGKCLRNVKMLSPSLKTFGDVIKPIALYLPQYHRIPENDKWWGEGFTEWTNVKKAKPLFKGHYQPHVPHKDIGYYDLSDVNVMRKQAAMAKKYGIYGFCFYYYHFANGKRLLEKPINNYLAAKDIDFPFCFCWANENWTRRWDGGENDVIMPQDYGRENMMNMFRDMLVAFKDPRYIKVGKDKDVPVLMVYRPEIIPDIKEIVLEWRKMAKAGGFTDVYVIASRNFVRELSDPRTFGMDASYDFYVPGKTCERYVVNGKTLYAASCESMIDAAWHNLDVPYPCYKGVTPDWDNTPRKGQDGILMIGAMPEKFKKNLEDVCIQTIADDKLRENGFVFVNAWNEWGEGAHLEPDEKNGYLYLEAVSKVMKKKL